MNDESEARPASGADTPGNRLDSWKEIAAYLRREVRTVQRWEKTEGLPVHRHMHEKQGSVYAFKSELEAWWRERRLSLEEENRQEVEATAAPARAHWLGARAKLWLGLAAVAALALLLLLPWRSPPASPDKTILIVVPCQNLSGDPEQDYFSEGLHHDLIMELSRLNPQQLGVIARTTVVIYKQQNKTIREMARELSADYVMECGVRHLGSQVKVTAQLIRASDQTYVWSSPFVRESEDPLAAQAELAREVARRIELPLTPLAQARLGRLAGVRSAAYQAYLQGRYHLDRRTPDALSESVKFFEQATRLQPDFALAYAGLADAYLLLGTAGYGVLPPRQALAPAKDAATRALDLEEGLAEAHATLAHVSMNFDWDWAKAEQQFRRALDLNPNYAPAHHWYAELLAATGRIPEALQQIRAAREAEPHSPLIQTAVAEIHYMARQYDETIATCLATLNDNPDFPLAHFHLGRAYLQKGMHQEAIEAFQKARAYSGDSPVMTMALGYAYAQAGQNDEAHRILAELHRLAETRYVSPLYISAVHAALGERDAAFEWLEKAYEDRSDYLVYLKVEPMADPLRSDPRFLQLTERIGLP